ncbi:hypothetical protein TU87_22725 [Pseudomonas weihenstephanensis]|nr:hypothetical protein TU87_22725 [Pseudomonas weihenstephanensis]
MVKNNEREIKLLEEIVAHIESVPYSPPQCAKYIYAKHLDECVYEFEDERLNEIFDVLGGMSAGEEFFYSKEEVLTMLNDHLDTLNVNACK